VPLLAASQPVSRFRCPTPIQDSGEETSNHPRPVARRSHSIYALQVRGNSMVDAMVGDGDIVVMQHRQEAATARWLPSG